jgi:hypothetical protein
LLVLFANDEGRVLLLVYDEDDDDDALVDNKADLLLELGIDDDVFVVAHRCIRRDDFDMFSKSLYYGII